MLDSSTITVSSDGSRPPSGTGSRPGTAESRSPLRDAGTESDDDEEEGVLATMRELLMKSSPEKRHQIISAAPNLSVDTLLKSGPVKGLRLKGKSLKTLKVQCSPLFASIPQTFVHMFCVPCAWGQGRGAHSPVLTWAYATG